MLQYANDEIKFTEAKEKTRMIRQPKEGRKQGGGFKIGIMEKDANTSEKLK